VYEDLQGNPLSMESLPQRLGDPYLESIYYCAVLGVSHVRLRAPGAPRSLATLTKKPGLQGSSVPASDSPIVRIAPMPIPATIPIKRVYSMREAPSCREEFFSACVFVLFVLFDTIIIAPTYLQGSIPLSAPGAILNLIVLLLYEIRVSV